MIKKLSKQQALTTLRCSSGFTIVELLVVIVVIGILAAITIVSYSGISQKARESFTQSEIKIASTQLALYKVEHDQYPTIIDPTTKCPEPSDNKYCLKLSPGTSFTYTPGSGSNPQTYTLNTVNSNLSYQVTDSTPPTKLGPPITGIAAITGTTEVSQILTAGAITPSGATVSYQWQSSTTSGGTYTNISGATSSTYIVSPSYIGKYFKVVATGTGSYSGTATSTASSQVAANANWLTVGTQTWAKYNQNVGTMVTGTTEQANNAVLEKYCYNNTESNCTTYGGLYQWNEAMQYVTTEGAQGICPAGSHVPSDNDWKILEMQLGMTQEEADDTGWRGTDQGTRLMPGGSSGLNIPLAGDRDISDGSSNNLGTGGFLWASSEAGSNAWNHNLNSGTGMVNHLTNIKAYGFSVRCLGN